MGSLDSLNLSKIWDCRPFSDSNTVTDSRPKDEVSQAMVSLSEPRVNQALELRPVQLFWIACQMLIDI